MNKLGTKIRGHIRWEKRHELCSILAVVGMALLSSGIWVTVSYTTIATGKGQSNTTSAKLSEASTCTASIAFWDGLLGLSITSRDDSRRIRVRQDEIKPLMEKISHLK